MFRMTECGISVPTHGSEVGIKDDWKNMIEGELCLREPCNSHTIIKYTTRAGELERERDHSIRKIPLQFLRAKLSHEQFMHLHIDEELINMTTDDLKYNECKIGIPENVSKDNLIAELS